MLNVTSCETPIRTIFTTANEAVKNRTIYTQPSFPTPIASKLLPLRVRLSCSTGTASRLMSFSDGGGEPSTQPFQPFFTATLFFRGGGGGGGLERSTISGEVSGWSSAGVRGRFDEVRDVAEDVDGPGVDCGEDGIGGGVTDTERCMVAMCMVGR